jgi:hypothetical protein
LALGAESSDFFVCPGKERGVKRVFPNTCVAPSGEFIYGIHKPRFTALNLRGTDDITILGHGPDKERVSNQKNFPETSVRVSASTWVFEIPNAFPFMGATFIVKASADRRTEKANPFEEKGKEVSPLSSSRGSHSIDPAAVKGLPRPLLLALAKTSADPRVLANLARMSCSFVYEGDKEIPSGMVYQKSAGGRMKPAVLDEDLFELVSNNPALPDSYKKQMVLVPGVQGESPIVGEYGKDATHIWEYLRKNSYIPWGHYAANMAPDAVRYDMASLSEEEVHGLRHLYYQRTYVQLALELGMAVPAERRSLTGGGLENLRLSLLDEMERWSKAGRTLPFNATIWGQNFGFDLSPSGYRLNASHQQVHQQFALVRSSVPAFIGGKEAPATNLATYAQGDLVAQFARQYKEETGQDFFETYFKAIQNNERVDGRADKSTDLIFFQDDNVILFVPKAQRSQGEIQIMTKGAWGNVIEAGTEVRASLDRSIWLAMQVLANLGVEMMTSLEISKRFDKPDPGQRLFYCFLPKHPQSPGGFSECQQRWIMGHYPEDFARVCGREAEKIMGLR